MILSQELRDRISARVRESHRRRREGFVTGTLLVGYGEIGPAPRTCQYIAGDPVKDATKCGEPVKRKRNGDRTPYCQRHFAICYRQPGEGRAGA